MQKKHPLFFLFLVTVCLARANDSTSTSNNSMKRFYAGVNFAPGISYRFLSQNMKSPQREAGVDYQFMVNLYNGLEKPAFGYNVGLNFGVNLTKFMSIETGIQFSARGMVIRQNNIRLAMDSNTYSLKQIITDYYLVIPVALNFCLGKKKTKAFITAGAGVDIEVLAAGKSILIGPGVKRTSTGSTTKIGHGKYNLSPFLGVGMEHTFNDWMKLRVFPVFQVQALDLENAPLSRHLWSVGVNANVIFGFVNAR